jgi:hypothetical protein
LADQEKVRGTGPGLKMLSRSKMLYCSKWSNIDMAAEQSRNLRREPEREQARDLRSPAPPSPQPGPPILNDGPEALRSSYC